MSAALYGKEVGRALREQYGERRHAAKVLAQKGDATPRAARSWMSDVGPQAATLIKLMAREPVVAEVVADLVERQRQLDAELEERRALRRAEKAP